MSGTRHAGGMTHVFLYTFLSDALKIEQVFQCNVENRSNALATCNRRRIHTAFNQTDKFNGIIAFLGELCLRQFSGSPQICDFPSEFSCNHVVKLCACKKSMNGVKLRFLLE